MSALSWRRVVGPLFSGVLLVLAILALRYFLRDHTLSDILEAAAGRPLDSIAIALGLTAVSYAILGGYDRLALSYVGRRIAYRRVALCSFIGYALSHNLGMSALVGGSVRYRLYSRYGIGPTDAAKIILFCNATFWVGFFAVGGAVLWLHPIPIPAFADLPLENTRPLGVACAIVTVFLFSWTAWGRGRPRLHVRGYELSLPDASLFVRQVAVSCADWIAAASVLHALLPEGTFGFADTLALFLLAQVLAMVSNLPGGVGVFESVAIYLAGDTDPAELLGVILVYRAVYYILPLAAALVALLVVEWRRHAGRAGADAEATR